MDEPADDAVSAPKPKAHLWLVGMMGSGKTAVGVELAERLAMGFVDTDAVVSRRAGCSISELWGARGESAFRSMEAAAVAEAAAGPPGVIATGGGAVLEPNSRVLMKGSGGVVWLAASPEALSTRVGEGSGRPLLAIDASPARLARLLAERSAAYEAAADLIVDTETTREEVVSRIEAWWNGS